MFLGKGFNKEIYYNKIEKMKKDDYVRGIILKLRNIADEEEKRKVIELESKELLNKVSSSLLKYPDALDNTMNCLSKENEHDLYLVLKLEIDVLYMFAVANKYKTLEHAVKNYKKFRNQPFSFSRH